MAGPWFAVQETGKWNTLDNIWVSNGRENITAKVELRLTFAEDKP